MSLDGDCSRCIEIGACALREAIAKLNRVVPGNKFDRAIAALKASVGWAGPSSPFTGGNAATVRQRGNCKEGMDGFHLRNYDANTDAHLAAS
ncbi:hypothetical protein [Thermoleptolyngbya sp. C42_A2020_037]|uniref:hypothetical protein n=1 Tax=Thermoleptolyngbya sp. C42_A2020_037 TaxID=2747799 RepID=UPI0019F9AB7E|nr:hypothetical protein [Thermoleptolyngbya sp. C42_A2020_037]MBF2083870.1 hypothetical protein [Thermoleptolyngbya sp. C42_A2020_037]